MRRTMGLIAVILVVALGCNGSQEPAPEDAIQPQQNLWVEMSYQYDLNYPGEQWAVFTLGCAPADFGTVLSQVGEDDFRRLRPEVAATIQDLLRTNGVDLIAVGSIDLNVRIFEHANLKRVSQEAYEIVASRQYCTTSV